jgi:uncharacterized protein (DUF697 family)
MAGYSVTYTVVDNATKQIDAINRRIAQTRAPLDRLSRQMSRFIDVSGLRKVATGFEWIGKAASSVLRTLTSIIPVMGTIVGAASIAGMAKLVSSYADWSRELVRAADNIGTTTQKLQQFQDATRLAGGNASDMTESLKGLHDKLADFNIGGANAAATGQWANKLKINLKDANGVIRSSTDLLPELIRKINELPDPADRAAAANALLGSSGEKLIQTFRQSSKSFDAWADDVKRYKDLTDDQKSSLQRFAEAQGRIGVAFDRLGQQIAPVIAKHLGPLLEKFAIFVEQNTPAILAAVDQLSERFAKWLADPETAKAFTAGIKAVADSLVWVSNNLDTVKTAVEVIAGLFAAKWAIGIASSIATVAQAFGVVGVGGAAGLGILGALGLIIWLSIEIVRHWDEIKQAGVDLADAVGKSFERVKKTMSDFWEGKHDPSEMPKPGEVPSYPKQPDFVPGGAWTPKPSDNTEPGGAWARPPGAIQKQSASGGYLPGGVTPAAYHPGGPAAAGIAGGSEFWDSMARAVTKGFEDAFDHITGTGGMGGGGAGGGGYTPAAYRVPVQAGAPSPNVQQAIVRPPGAGGGVGGGSAGGSGGIDAPAGTPIARTGLATVTSASGRKFQVDARFAPNFQGFIDDYEKAGGQIGPDSGTLGERPHNASGHPIGAAIDINQIGRGVRSKRAISLDPRIEDALAKKWGMVSGNSWRSNDQGHFGIESVEAARRALIDKGVAVPNQAAGGAAIQTGWNANNPMNLTPGSNWHGGRATTPGGLPIRTYGSMEEGVADSVRKLVEYQQKRHLATVDMMAREWNKTATPEYVNKLADALHVGKDQPFDIRDPDKAAAWVRAAQPQETGPGRLTEAQIAAGVRTGLAPPVTVPPPQPPNGAVDVSITHKNAPPNSAVTATGSGAVNVAPVRVEHQAMESI